MPEGEQLDRDRLRRLIEVGRAFLAELEPEALLDRVLETACEITNARYAALGILDPARHELERFVTRGIEAETRRAIGDLPRGRGVLGVLIEDPRPLRLSNVGDHPRSYGFPVAHPPMHSFLGVPILIRGQAWGNLYLTEKADGDFDAADEEAAVILADWAAIAIENSRLYQAAEARAHELEQATRRLEASRAIAMALGAETELDRILELIVKRGRALIHARTVVILLRRGTDLVVAASAGEGAEAIGGRLPMEGSTAGYVLEHGTVERIADMGARLRISPWRLGISGAQTALLAPLVYRGESLGVMEAFDRTTGSPTFSEEDEQTLRAFAAIAATAVAGAQTVARERLRESLESAEAERGRWARELHDETLQGLGGLRVLLSSVLKRRPAPELAMVLEQAVGQIESEIDNLRSLITELRPPALDELGLAPAIEALVSRVRTVEGLDVESEIELPGPDGKAPPLAEDLETTVYRLVQEALTNVAKHARAERVTVRVRALEGAVEVEVMDDGLGFDPAGVAGGFGLVGMRERVMLAGGEFSIAPASPGTVVRARLPLAAAAPSDLRSTA